MASNTCAPEQQLTMWRLGKDPNAVGFKVRTITDTALLLCDESYIVATLNIVQDLQQEFSKTVPPAQYPANVEWKAVLDYWHQYDQLKHTLDLAVYKLKDALRAFDEYDYGGEEEPPYHGNH